MILSTAPAPTTHTPCAPLQDAAGACTSCSANIDGYCVEYSRAGEVVESVLGSYNTVVICPEGSVGAAVCSSCMRGFYLVRPFEGFKGLGLKGCCVAGPRGCPVAHPASRARWLSMIIVKEISVTQSPPATCRPAAWLGQLANQHTWPSPPDPTLCLMLLVPQDSQGQCATCQSAGRDANCVACSEDGQTCTTCKEGYFMVGACSSASPVPLGCMLAKVRLSAWAGSPMRAHVLPCMCTWGNWLRMQAMSSPPTTPSPPDPPMPSSCSLPAQVGDTCESCQGYLMTHCAYYSSGQGNDIGVVSTKEELCPEGSTSQPSCTGCAAGFYSVSVLPCLPACGACLPALGQRPVLPVMATVAHLETVMGQLRMSASGIKPTWHGLQ